MHHAKRRAVVLATMIAAAIAAAGGAVPPDPNEPKLLWRADLHTQGLTHHRLGMFMFSSHDHQQSSRNQDAVAINSGGQVAVAFATFLERNGDGYEPGTAKLHLSVHDSATGKLAAAKEWPAPDASKIVDAPALSTTLKGDFLLEYAGQLTLYSPSLQIIRSAEIESRRPRFSYWASPDGRYAFFSGEKDRIKFLTMVDTDTLQVLRSISPDRPISAASTQYLAAWTLPVQAGPAPKSLEIQPKKSEWEPFYLDAGCQAQYSVAVGFLNDTNLIISSCEKLSVINAEHKVLFSQTLSKRQTIEQIRRSFYSSSRVAFSSSADGERFAIAEDQPKRDPWWFGDPGTGPVPVLLLVYDVSVSGKAIASFELHGRYETDYDRLSFALSPDGMLLALIRDTNLDFVRLPPRSTH